MVDLNDPETKKQIDAYLEHEKHAPLDERAEDLGNREPAWVWAGVMFAFLGIIGILWKACS